MGRDLDDCSPSSRRMPASVQALFEGEGLALPYLPPSLTVRLQPLEGGMVFATRALSVSPYDLRSFLAELPRDGGLQEYAVVGMDGHGLNSWAMHCYMVTRSLALFIQLPWGGAYLDADEARAEIGETFAWAHDIQARWAAAQQRGSVPGERIEIVCSSFIPSGWRWLKKGCDFQAVAWNDGLGMKTAILDALDARLAG